MPPPEISERRRAMIERKIRHKETLTLQEVADYLGMWRGTVYDIEASALRKMREAWLELAEIDEQAFASERKR
jgi:DNA-directed RNA polymerase sigma subunit (sigma70/sigma32)